MKAATGKYSEEAKKLLSGKITQFSYTTEVLSVLAKRKIRLYAPSYIRLVVTELRNQDAIWDAIVEVIADRKKIKDQEPVLTANIKELVEVD
ncbi:hypothetical protein [Spirosoma foliorum]|uniref:Uncharacterized protein n=1 Tax=Spirosoma foliorum TaxID=2710596 RepID=A0A7G5H2P6_9BACT|nr:hypothetical protein [Spirosoma foliorum]QMW05388.1 hypothetical protein H3H32_11090 [Spirosoma foliorum]